MTTQLIQLKSLPNVALVMMPEGASDIAHVKDLYLSGNVIQWWIPDQNGVVNDVGSADLPSGTWRIVSSLAEISEEQANGLVEKVMNGQHYQNYNYKPVAERWVKTALESFHSAIKADGWYLENPYGKHEPIVDDPDPHSQYHGAQQDDLLRWQMAQQRVLDPERTLVIERV